jgi:alpha-glucosidase
MPDPALQTCGPVASWEAEPHALVVRHAEGLTRIDAVARDILRVRFSPSGGLAPQRSWDPVAALPPTPLRVSEAGEALRLDGGAIQAVLDRGTGALACFDARGLPFAHDLGGPAWRELDVRETPFEHTPEPELPPGRARTGVFLDKLIPPDEGYFGFGQRTGRLDRRYSRLGNWNLDPCSPGVRQEHDNRYQTHPCFLALRPDLAWGLYLHSTWYSRFDVGATNAQALSLFTLGGELDYYLLAGPTPAAVVEQLTRLTGRPALPPLWAMGYHQSRWSYGSDGEVQALARAFRERGIPLDAIHLDIDYMDGFRVFTWDGERFPDPAHTVQQLLRQSVRAVAIVDPGVKKELGHGYTPAEEGVADGHFIGGQDGTLFSGYVWPGEALFPDFCRPETRRWWGDQHQGLLDAGIGGIWCDMNEPAIVDRPFPVRGVRNKSIPLATRLGGPAEPALEAETHNLYGHLMARAATEGQARLRPDRRPWTLTRSGHLGTHRWAASWMGDNRSSWDDLGTSLPQLASMGLCGSPHVGVDIGGFFDNCFGELFARWIELGTFYPFMRCHTALGTHPQQPWSFGPGIEAMARAAIELRYRLLPYLYTLAHRAHRTGEPLLRPLLYEFPDQKELHQIEDQVMIGPCLMVAPVCRPGVRRRLVELPAGCWYDFRTGAPVGPGPLVLPAPLGQIPILVRAGTILTLGNVRQTTAEPVTELTLLVYPAAAGAWTLIEDDGETPAYQDGELAETDLRIEPTGDGVIFTQAARRGGFLPHPRTLLLRIHLGGPPAAVRLDGQETPGWHWDQQQYAIELSWADDGKAHEVMIREGQPREAPR